MTAFKLGQWVETERYTAVDGLVHVVRVRNIDGTFNGRMHVLQCPSKKVMSQDRKTPVTCLSCLSEMGVG